MIRPKGEPACRFSAERAMGTLCDLGGDVTTGELYEAIVSAGGMRRPFSMAMRGMRRAVNKGHAVAHGPLSVRATRITATKRGRLAHDARTAAAPHNTKGD